MKALFDSIYDKFIADGKYGLDALYNTENTENVEDIVYPYAVISLVAVTTERASFTEDWENTLIQFNLFSNAPKSTVINAACLALTNAFHKFDLVVVGYDTISMVKEVANLIRVEKVWQYNISFRIIIQEE